MRRAIHIHLHRGTTDRAPGGMRPLYEDLARRMQGALQELLSLSRTADAVWKEDLHPRAEDGRFGHKAGEHASEGMAPKPTTTTAKGGMDKIRELLASGHSFTKAEFLAATGLTEKRLSDYLAMLKNPKWAGAKGALSIERKADGSYFVGMPAPGGGVVQAPAPEAPKPPPVVEPTPPAAPAPQPPIPAPQPAAAPAPMPSVDAAAKATAEVYAGRIRPYVPQTSTKAAAVWAVENGYVDRANWGKTDIRVVNEHMQALHDHLAEFPQLRKQQEFLGSTQEFYAYHHENQIKQNLASYRIHYPGRSDADLLEMLNRRITKKKVPGAAWAMAHAGAPGYHAITFNEKHMSKAKMPGIDAMQKRSVDNRWHPEGCENIKSNSDHELGHQLDTLLNLRKNPRIAELRLKAYGHQPGQTVYGGIAVGPHAKVNMKQAVSDYANTNIQEFIAEAWSEYRNNPNPRPIAARLGEIVKDEYAKKYHT